MTTNDLPFEPEMELHRQQNEEAEKKSLVATIREEMRRIEEKHRKIQNDHVRNP